MVAGDPNHRCKPTWCHPLDGCSQLGSEHRKHWKEAVPVLHLRPQCKIDICFVLAERKIASLRAGLYGGIDVHASGHHITSGGVGCLMEELVSASAMTWISVVLCGVSNEVARVNDADRAGGYDSLL